jgi:hypothetical protein
LLATGVLSRVCSRFKIDLPIRTIFENATLASLAAAIDGIKDNNGSFLTPAIRAIPRRLQRLNLS